MNLVEPEPDQKETPNYTGPAPNPTQRIRIEGRMLIGS